MYKKHFFQTYPSITNVLLFHSKKKEGYKIFMLGKFKIHEQMCQVRVKLDAEIFLVYIEEQN